MSKYEWKQMKLGDCLDLVNGRAYKQTELLSSGTPVLRIQNLNGGDNWYFSDLDLPKKNYCNKGDLLFAWSATFGPYRWDGPKAIFHYHIWNIIPNDQIDIGFAYYLLLNISASVKAAAHGITMVHITKEKMLDWPISLPPLPEQKRIAAILDKADSLRRKNQQAIQLADKFLRAVFLDMFGDPVTNPKGWETKKLKEITSKIGSGATPRGGQSAYVDQGISLIRSLNIHDDKFLHKDLAFITDQQADALSNVEVKKNDVLLNITGASVCRCAMADHSILPARVNQHVCIIRSTEMESEYLLHLLISNSYKQKLLKIAGAAGATREALTKEQIENLDIPIPPRNMQEKFALIKAKIKSIVDAMYTANSLSLFDSLSQKAFAGEL